jgi:class 3 adenylate cyclase
MEQPPAPLQGYRRHLVVVFTDVSNWSGLAQPLDLERRHLLLAALHKTFAPIATRHGGELVQKEGDGFAILFGHDAIYEEAGRRATEAALDIHAAAEAFRRRNVRIRILMHTGINSGLALVLPGDVVSGRYEMLGEVTNMAKRLCGLAGPGEILVSDTSLGADRLFFRTGPRRTVTLRGYSIALDIYPVLGREPIESRFIARTRRSSTAFSGRHAELARLGAILEGCRGE